MKKEIKQMKGCHEFNEVMKNEKKNQMKGCCKIHEHSQKIGINLTFFFAFGKQIKTSEKQRVTTALTIEYKKIVKLRHVAGIM